MKITKIPKPWNYKLTCEMFADIMKMFFCGESDRLNPRIYGDEDDAFIKCYLFDNKCPTVNRGWFWSRPKKVEQEKQVARFEYFPKVDNQIKVFINESDFTDSFKDKVSKMEAFCKGKLEFEVRVQEGK